MRAESAEEETPIVMTEPPLPGLRLRPFAGDSDFPAMAEVANAVFAADARWRNCKALRLPCTMCS
jgi:hypothetical protein